MTHGSDNDPRSESTLPRQIKKLQIKYFITETILSSLLTDYNLTTIIPLHTVFGAVLSLIHDT